MTTMTARAPAEAPTTRLTIGDDGLAVIDLLGPGGKPFILSEPAVAELEEHVETLAGSDTVRGVLIASQHEKVFCAGADVDAIAGLEDPAVIESISRRGQELFQAIEDLQVPVAALIHGACVGGGLELALACHLRIASDDRATKLGVPEVQLGILPAWGGTTRLPEVIGLKATLPLILTGRLVPGRKAERLGLVTECVPRELLVERGRTRIADLAHAWEHGHHGSPTSRRVGVTDYLADEVGAVRSLVLSAARKRVERETGGHYPAPLAILDVLQRGADRPRDERFALEREALGRLATSTTCKHLVSIFTRNRDKERGAPYDIETKDAPPVRRVGIIGAGVMGCGIATALLLKGRAVRLIDPFPEALVKARRAIERELRGHVKRRRLDRFELRRLLSKLTLADGYAGLPACDLVIEAVPEVPAIKEEALRLAADAASSAAMLTTNTSSLGVSGLAGHVTDAGRFAGLHFFNPAPKMPLVEIVRTDRTTDETLARLIGFVRSIGKTPVVVKDSPAFVVNRLLAPYLLEAFRLLLEGAATEDIDLAARAFGLPMGPLMLMDTVGLDVTAHVCRYLSGFPDMGVTLPPLLERMVERGRLGKKSRSGFYDWSKRKPRPVGAASLLALDPETAGPRPATHLEANAIRSRLLGALAREARRVLDEEVVASEDDLDLASIYGMGFPPHTGGIATWLRESEGRAAS